MNKRLLLLVVLLLLASSAVFVVTRYRSRTKSEIILAAILPLSGNGADQGEWVRRGLELAANDLNAQSGPPVRIVYGDSQGGDSTVAISEYNSLKTRYAFPLVFTWGSGVGTALTPIVNNDRVVQMGVATATPLYSTLSDFTFRNYPSASAEGSYVADALLSTLNQKNISLLSVNNDYGVGVSQALSDAFEKAGGVVNDRELFTIGDTDFRMQLTKLKQKNSQVIYLASYPNEGALILRQARELGLTMQFISSTALLGAQGFFDAAGTAAEGLLVVGAPFEGSASVDRFKDLYLKTYHEPVRPEHIYAARAFDALEIVGRIARSCTSVSGSCVRDGLSSVSGYKGASGQITFDGNGDILSNFALYRVKQGALVPYASSSR
ncbi:MAG: ABC transporter substrate-binding protein [Patescibacteria group bacterium]|jgi:branched-chain amino acid transport system substrate-binding protein